VCAAMLSQAVYFLVLHRKSEKTHGQLNPYQQVYMLPQTLEKS
jgi:hypothetical protein